MKKAGLLFGAVFAAFLVALLLKTLWLSGVSSSTYYPTVWALIWAGVAFWLAEDLSNSGVGRFAVFILSGAIGAALGWLFGIYFFPKSSEEAAHFQTIGTVMGTFLSGYLLKEFGDLWKYLATPGAQGALPPILMSPRKEYLAFFLASLLISGGVQYGTRSLESIRVGWNGTMPVKGSGVDANRYVLPAGSRFQLAGAMDSGDDPAVRWSVESPSDPGALKEAKEDAIVSVDPDTGVILIAPKDKWTKLKNGFDAQIIVTAVAKPDVARAVDVKFDPNVAAAEAGTTAPAPTTSTDTTTKTATDQVKQ